MTVPLTPVETRLLALLQKAASSALEDGRAEVVVTTERTYWSLPPGDGDGERLLALTPRTHGAVRIGILRGEVTNQEHGWHLFVGDGPQFEYWEGAEADYQRTDEIVRAVVHGRYRQWWERQEGRGLLLRWRVRRSWVLYYEMVLQDGTTVAPILSRDELPTESDTAEFQALPY